MRRVILEIILFSLFFLIMPWFFLPGSESGFLILSLTYLAFTAIQISLLLIVLKYGSTSLQPYGIKRPAVSTWGWMGFSLLGAMVILCLCSFVLYIIAGDGAGETLFKRPFTRPPTPLEIPLLVLFCLAVGYREEIFFRSYLITRLGGLGVKPVWAVAGSSLVFGMAHFYEGLFGIITAGLIGAFFGFMFVKKKDLHVVAGAHALYNLGVWVVGFVLK